VIYDKDPETGQWIKKDKIAENQESSDFNHKAPINRIKWCDPEFGSVIASCSSDKSFKIWAEEPYYSEQEQEVRYKFNYKTTNTLREAIADIDFAPKHFQNLMVAVAVTNGTISIFEQNNLESWRAVLSDKKISQEACKCLAWNPAFDEPASLIVGCDGSENNLQLLVERTGKGFENLKRVGVFPDCHQ